MSNAQYHSPSKFGPFDVYEQLGIGGMATVHRAIERESGRVVALKRILPQFESDKACRQEFQREAEIGRALKHRNVIEFYQSGQIDRVCYISMEWVQGTSLRTILESKATLQAMPVAAALWVLREILNALDYAMNGLDAQGEAFQIVHRDLSPANIIITDDGEVKLIDFGVAKSLTGKYATDSGLIKGRFGYMSPEVLRGKKVELRSDLYSIGVIAWELLTNTRLFSGSLTQRLVDCESRNIELPSSLNSAVPEGIDDLVKIALSDDPNSRWPSATAMLVILNSVIDRRAYQVSKDAIVSWMRAPNDNVADVIDAAPPTQPDIAYLPTLAAQGVRTKQSFTKQSFPKHLKTVLDPIFDAAERHRLTDKKSGNG